MITKARTMAAGVACAAGLATATATVALASQGASSVAAYLKVTPPSAFLPLTVKIPGAPVRIFHGRLFVTAMARHTPYSP